MIFPGYSLGSAIIVLKDNAGRAHPSGWEYLAPKDKEHRPDQAQPGPEIIEPHRFFHVESGERHEHAQCDHLLQDLELSELQLGMSDAVRGHLEQILE